MNESDTVNRSTFRNWKKTKKNKAIMMSLMHVVMGVSYRYIGWPILIVTCGD